MLGRLRRNVHRRCAIDDAARAVAFFCSGEDWNDGAVVIAISSHCLSLSLSASPANVFSFVVSCDDSSGEASMLSMLVVAS